MLGELEGADSLKSGPSLAGILVEIRDGFYRLGESAKNPKIAGAALIGFTVGFSLADLAYDLALLVFRHGDDSLLF